MSTGTSTSVGEIRNEPAWRPSRPPKMLGESKRGTHIQSTEPLGANNANTSPSLRNPYSPMGTERACGGGARVLVVRCFAAGHGMSIIRGASLASGRPGWATECYPWPINVGKPASAGRQRAGRVTNGVEQRKLGNPVIGARGRSTVLGTERQQSPPAGRDTMVADSLARFASAPGIGVPGEGTRMGGNASFRQHNTSVLSVCAVEAPTIMSSAAFDERLQHTYDRVGCSPACWRSWPGSRSGAGGPRT